MIALDTNVVVRFLMGDDPVRARQAMDLIETAKDGIFVSPTVLLETAWVLKSAYALAPADIVRLLRDLLGLPGVETEQPLRVARALDRHEAGLDFADALHLAFAEGAEIFVTFDEKLVRRARHIDRPRVIAPQSA